MIVLVFLEPSWVAFKLIKRWHCKATFGVCLLKENWIFVNVVLQTSPL